MEDDVNTAGIVERRPNDTREVFDPFKNEAVQISNRLVDRLRGKYAVGPTLPNGEPEFGWRQMPASPINIEAADRIEALERELSALRARAHKEEG